MTDLAKLVWITPNAQEMIVHTARVSNPQSQAEGKAPERLINYLIKHHHWSPFEMATACIEINTTRDIARQILRHRSFSFQEFSQRYAEVDTLREPITRQLRMQDTANRQNSLEVEDPELAQWWASVQAEVAEGTMFAYQTAIEKGIAKEVARAILPEGLTPSRLYMTGTIRSWLHYIQIRASKETQKEHREIAIAIERVLFEEMPDIIAAMPT